MLSISSTVIGVKIKLAHITLIFNHNNKIYDEQSEIKEYKIIQYILLRYIN